MDDAAAFGDSIARSLDDHETGCVLVFRGAGQEPGHVVMTVQQKAAGVKGMRCLFIGQKGQFPGIRSEEVIVSRVTAHLGCVHESRVSHQHRPVSAFLTGHKNAVVPVHVGHQVMEGEPLRIFPVWQFGSQAGIKLPAALPVASIPAEQCFHRSLPES